MKRDPSLILLGEDIGAYGGAFKVTGGLFEEFGAERVIDTPISEAMIVGGAIGASLVGMRVVCEMQFADFISCAFDQVVNMAATLRYRHGGTVGCPIVIRCPSGAGIHGGLFHSQNPEAWFFHVPGLKIVAPATVYDAKGLLKTAIRDDDPVLFFEHKALYRKIKEDIPEEEFLVPIGRAEVRRKGKDLTIVTYSASLYIAIEAADILFREGIEAEIVDLRTLLPLDKDTILKSFKKTSKAMILHEARKSGGIGAEIAAIVAEEAFEYMDGPVVRVATEDTHYAFSPPLEEFILPNVEKVVKKARELARY